MYVILVYDVASRRGGKLLRLCRRYLHWIQNSVFEGTLTESNYKKLLQEAKDIMDLTEDSLIIFRNRSEHYLEKELFGVEKGPTDQFL